MSTHDLIGLRDEDLSPSERALRDALLASDRHARADHELSLELSSHLSDAVPGGPSLARIRAPQRPSSARWATGAVLLLAASTLVWLAVPTAPLTRDRGVAAGPVGVRLTALAEGPDGVRKLAPGASVYAEEQVVFWVDASGPGELRLIEDGSTAVYPTSGASWRATAGEQVLGGAAPLAYRPDGAGTHHYEVQLCDAEDRCATDRLALQWLPR